MKKLLAAKPPKPARASNCLNQAPVGLGVLPAAKSVSEANGLSEDKTMQFDSQKGKTRQLHYYRKEALRNGKDRRAVSHTKPARQVSICIIVVIVSRFFKASHLNTRKVFSSPKDGPIRSLPT